MSSKTTFEHLCAGKSGYTYDENSMVRLTKQESYNDLVFKLTTKCETNLLFLPSPTCVISKFTLDIISDNSDVRVASAWHSCEGEGYDGMHVIASLDESNMPQLTTFSFAQFINSLIHGLEAHFLFQKFNKAFVLNGLNLWKALEDNTMSSCCVVMIWKFNRKPLEDILSRSPLSQLNSSISETDGGNVPATGTVRSKTLLEEKTQDSRRRTLPAKQNITPAKAGRKRRGSEAPPPPENDACESSEDEISFRKSPIQIIPKVTYLKGMSPKAPVVMEPMETETTRPEPDPIAMEDITLGFEIATPKKGARKSNARKSLMPDWPQEEKDQILQFYDSLNPNRTEQTCVALTCKFAQMQYDRELPSKLLYQWIQKKGREINKTVTSFEIPESEQHQVMLDLYKELNPTTSETSRVAFICKFMNMQYGITITAKIFYDLLKGKAKKAPKRR